MTVLVENADVMQDLGRRLGEVLRSGDLVVLDGPLGAGKTTLTQGIAAGLRVRGQITSPTFVIARVHPSLGDGPYLVHVDAYRIGGTVEVEDLDLDASVEEAVTVVEWGEGLVEGLQADRLVVSIAPVVTDQSEDDSAAGPREVSLRASGPSWAGRLDNI